MAEISITYPENGKNKPNSIVFDIMGNKEKGLNKSIINFL